VQDFSWLGVEPPAPPFSALNPEQHPNFEGLIGDPEKMYWYSLKTKRRLPEELHGAMMLWSFVPDQKQCVQMYLDWTAHCEEMDSWRSKHEARMRRIDRMMTFSMCACGVLLALAILFK
jgi:hypothetical protein